MRRFSSQLRPTKPRLAKTAASFGAGASSNPAAQQALASLQYQRMGGASATPKHGGRKVKLPPHLKR